MRREIVLERLEAKDMDGAYAFVSAVLRRSDRTRPSLPHLQQTLNQVLVEGGATRPLDYEWRAALYAVAAEHRDEFLMRLLRSSDAAAAMQNTRAALPKSVADIPLGVRRALAKGDDKGLLDRLLLDPDAIVVGHLLENPRITEDDMVRIAARRPIPGSTLSRIRRSRRFGSRLRVRLAVAQNPYCPTELALEVLGTLPADALKDIARDGTLHEEVRQHARDEMTHRAGSLEAGPPEPGEEADED